MACKSHYVDECYAELKQFIEKLPTQKGALIAVLHKAQGIFGFLPEEVQSFVATELNIKPAEVYGVVSFYSFFTMTPKGDNPISICLGTACYVKGAEDIVAEIKDHIGLDIGQVSEDGEFSLDAVRCVGACSLAPVVLIKDKVYGRLKKGEIKGILDSYMKGDGHEDN